MTKRQQEIKALIEGHSTHREQYLLEFMAKPVKYPSITTSELEEIKPIAEQISDRFFFAVCGLLQERRVYESKIGTLPTM